MIGNAHLDPVWLWQWRDGYHEAMATFRSALDRLNETPDFVFTCACACYYEWVEENDPAMFEEIRRRVAEGRWGIVGGMWIQPDMNTPSGESLLRQTLYAQRYFRKKFGKIATVGYNVDTFGHNAMTPQLLRLSGMTDYVWMRPSVKENGKIPEGPMIWEAPDGSRVQAYRIFGEYTTAHDMPGKIEKVLETTEAGPPLKTSGRFGNTGRSMTGRCLTERPWTISGCFGKKSSNCRYGRTNYSIMPAGAIPPIPSASISTGKRKMRCFAWKSWAPFRKR